jgi:tetratricopeptide (TPR) repeat protein
LYTQRASLYLALGKFAEARNDYERVQKQEAAEADADLVRQAYVGILVEALSGDYDKAAAKAEAVVKEHAGDLHWLYDVACAYAIAAEVAGKDPKLADRAGRAKQLGDRALEVLADTIKAGYTNFIHVRTDPDFLVLHNDPRFRQLARFPDAKGK